ncbi:efflux RND transporter periplasmic adaptor subunit [Dyadobacter chenhuakuii]|uniref:Efflux RND transporter periplasmic adaptor subunit n=1 Tax=Dyadobacter chenhuakuii TaxID=2909339 RepID=A0ABY4XQJ5_9BACT|nr:efflux RND transporter periplasmic adaptor subunit [Dyadobacter chenhuakuii]MCF2492998.1 efflux RND transporter periplasmic adaptor subunit [Dyadobacter chenhuakuii]USJ32714.1 efflux RND transporter periplasmic adaptor subunit [Dyadobacter chenhuakuii]
MLHNSKIFLVLTMLTLTLAGCNEKQETVLEKNPKTNAAPARAVETYAVQMEPVTQSIRLNGQIEYNPNQVVHYASLVNGIVTKTYFSLGDKVAKGQVLAELRSNELTGLSAQNKTLKSQLNVAERKLSVVESMFSDRIGSEKDLLEAQSEVAILKAEIDKVQSSLSFYNASSEKGIFQIKAPIGGYVVENNISAGTQISGNDSDLFTISNLADVWVTTNVYAVDLPFVQKGMKAVIKSKAYPDEAFDGVVSEISQVFDPNERVLKARILMPNKEMKFKPGLTIEAVIKKQLNDKAIGLPANALIFHNNENYLLIQKPDQTLEPRKVTVDVKDNDRIFIKNGIAAGEKVVIGNQLLLFSEAMNASRK